MRILYDGSIYAVQTVGGISRYFGSLISRLPVNVHPSLVVGSVLNSNYPSRPDLKVYEANRLRLIPVSYRLSLHYSRIRNLIPRIALASKHFDVLHPTYYTLVNGRSISSYRRPVVITVWDMIHELFPSELDPTGQHAEEKGRAIQAAQRVICISENTKRDLLERYEIPEDKVTVTHLASEIDITLSYGPEPVPSRPYYLYVGGRHSYKNFDGLLRAFAKVVSIRPELALCIVGGRLSDEEMRLINSLKLGGHIEYSGNPTDSHLAKLYRCSLALVYPSFYEGFGLPPLEAMSCGTVAIVSNVSSIPEVVGNAGLLFDPYSVDELIDILCALPEDHTRRENLILSGQQRAKEFSWSRTVAQTIDVYRSAVG